MGKTQVLWVDLRCRPCLPGVCRSLPGCYEVLHINRADSVPAAIRRTVPNFLCFEYDHPVAEQLDLLRDTRLEWPSLPVLMITVSHSEDLAVFALRMRVWDYLVMPVSGEELGVRFDMLSRMSENPDGNAAGHSVARVGGDGGDCEVQGSTRQKSIVPALGFVEENLPEKISLGDVARLCGMGRFQFSRAFKQVQGITFQEFLMQRRINRAIELLRHPKASVTDVAFAVGFNDLSYFARVFRRYTGVSPSLYRHENEVQQTMRLPVPVQPPNPTPGWPIAKYFYPTATKF